MSLVIVASLANEATFQPGPDPSSGMDGMAGLFVVGLLISVGITVWKVSTARRMARDSGMDEGDATAMTLLTDDGLESTYLASNLRHRQPPATPQPQTTSSARRLEELQELRNRGLITEAEYAQARARIIGGV